MSQKDVTVEMAVDLICMGTASMVSVAENSVCITVHDAAGRTVMAVRAHQRKA